MNMEKNEVRARTSKAQRDYYALPNKEAADYPLLRGLYTNRATARFHHWLSIWEGAARPSG